MFRGFGDAPQTTCDQEKAILSSNVESLRTSYVNTKKFAVVGVLAAGIIGYLIGKR